MTGTLTRRLIFHAAIDTDRTSEQRHEQLRLALRRKPVEADWQTCAAIRDAHLAGDPSEVNRLIQTLTKED
jgi:hypothetical protein